MRRSVPYSLFWVTREAPRAEVSESVAKLDGGMIECESVQAFFEELKAKLAILASTAAGTSPTFVVAETRRRIAAAHQPSIRRDLLRYEREALNAWRQWYALHAAEHTSATAVADMIAQVSPIEAVGVAAAFVGAEETMSYALCYRAATKSPE